MLKLIARQHFPTELHPFLTDNLLESVHQRLAMLGAEAERRRLRRPGTAEYLDALRACDTLQVSENDIEWQAITQATLWKADVDPETDRDGDQKDAP